MTAPQRPSINPQILHRQRTNVTIYDWSTKTALPLRRLHSFDGRLQRENKTSYAIDLALM
jgi:hypothetical protein